MKPETRLSPETPPAAVAPARPSVYNRGALRFETRGVRVSPFEDLYHSLLRTSWWRLAVIYFLIYCATNTLFAGLYWLGGAGTILNAPENTFADMFWFSVQTLATIGYGVFAPNSTYAHILVTFESFTGLLMTALITGLVFAKFSKPVARVVFSRNVLVTSRNGEPILAFRVANQRTTALLEATLKVHALMDEVSAEGVQMRRAHVLHLERSEMPVFSLAWTLIHPLNSSSPLYGLSEENVAERVVSIITTFSGTDDALAQAVRARRNYTPEDMRFGYRFVDMIEHSVPGMLIVDHAKLDSLVKEQDVAR